MVKLVIEMVLFIWILALSWQDIRKKEVSTMLLLAGMGIALCSIGIIIGVKGEEGILISKAAGMLFGGILIGVSKISKGQIGMGDAVVFTITGVVFGFWNNLFLLFYSLVLSAIYAGILLLKKKIHKKQSIAFLPFVAIGMLGVIFG